MKQSPLYRLYANDWIKGFIMAIGGGILNIVATDVNANNWAFDITALWHGAFAAGLTYLLKNFFTPATPIKEVTKTDDGTVTKTVIQTDNLDVNIKNPQP